MHDSEARQKGQEQYRLLFGKERRPREDETALDEFTLNHLFANVWSRTQLSMPQRSMITVALLAALGRDRELKRHVEGALHQRITREQINEIMLQVAHYAGWPAGHNGQRIAQEVFEERLIVSRYVVSEGHDSTVARLLRKNAEASRAEPGCLEFSVYQEIDDPRAFLLYERYTSEDAFQAHRRTPHFEDIIEQQVVPLLDERAWTRVEPLPT